MKKTLQIVAFALGLLAAPASLAAIPAGENTDTVVVVKNGDLSPDFQAQDMTAKYVHVSDFHGKYIYIDIWATWCGPCMYQVPFLKELEEKLDGRNIVFVSLSTEANRGKWANTVKEHEMGGVQLSSGGNKSFTDAYGVAGIPRFILLDREGRVLNTDMSRPSDPETIKTLLALPGI